MNSTQLLAYPKLVQTVLSVSNQIGILVVMVMEVSAL